jgi:multidrug efflux system membrane fusion protein
MPARKILPTHARLTAFSRRLGVALLIVLLIAAGIYAFLHWAAGKKREPAPAPRVPVAVAEVKRSDVAVYTTGLGSVTPLNTVTVRTRVDGQLMEVLFRDGQIVSRGDLLARIDPRPFEAQLAQAEGQMIRDKALLENARLDLERYRVLWAQNSIQKQQLDTQEALVRQYEGVVKTDQGLIDSAKLQLVYCRITATLSGRAGFSLVDPGNIVHASDTNGLVVLTQLQPITVVFPIPEDNLPQVLGRFRAGARLPVEAYDRTFTRKIATGYLAAIDNLIDPATGTVRLKAMFPNRNNELFPNQFVNARLLVHTIYDALVVPTAAIQRGPKGTFVYVVSADKTAGMRPVGAGESQGGATVVTSGLSPGELVVVEGADRLREGAGVEITGRQGGSFRRGG